ncbi:MAG: histidine phosphatase family protein [Vicinamibacterales bacterium]
MSARVWYLVRHSETEWNAVARMQGQLDSPLTALGREHAKSSGRLLARLGVDALYASPLGRVRQTLDVLAEDVPLPASFDDRLKEWSGGEWSGELYSDLATKWPDAFAAWTADRYHQRSPGGENFVDMIARARSFIADVADPPGSRIAVVAHGFFNRTLAGALLGLSPSEIIAIRQSNDVVIRIVLDGDGPATDHFVDGDGPLPGLPGSETQQRESA